MKPIPIKYKNMMYYAVVDDDDFDRTIKYTWKIDLHKKENIMYVVRSKDNLPMHVFIMKPSKDKMVDHKDHDGASARLQSRFFQPREG